MVGHLDVNYDPSIFLRVTSLQEAKRIILTDEQTLNTDQRWERETPHICDLIHSQINLTDESIVLDYGCGIGRIAKELIKRHNCFVIGADISHNMQALASSYVASDRFIACHPHALQVLGTSVDLVLAVWVLQHVANLTVELSRIKSMMLPDSKLFVVNEKTNRFVPTDRGWVHDDVYVRPELEVEFDHMVDGEMNPAIVGIEQSQRTFWASYRKEPRDD